MCQLNLVVGDLAGNVAMILQALHEAEQRRCDVAVLPELAITGYPPEDLLLKPGFIADNEAALETIARQTRECATVVGFVQRGEQLHNAAAVCAHGTVAGVYNKRLLPNYAVFDEERYFEPGTDRMPVFSIAGTRVGVSICEDAWRPEGPVLQQARAGAEVVLNINASPFHAGKVVEREKILRDRVAEAGLPIVYVNLVGGQDELVFDGASMVLGDDGSLHYRAPQFEEAVVVIDVSVPDRPEVETPIHVSDAPAQRPRILIPHPSPLLDEVEEVYQALVLGTRDYVTKNGFDDVVVALSGGIDSSLVTTVAADALGPEHVHAVLMPSRYSSDHSLTDAELLCRNLGVDHRTIPIEPAHAALLGMLAESFEGLGPDVTEENIQSRIRGVVVMALSNKFGWLVLTTGNKSESAVGYSTLYGDTAGGFAVIKDVPKLLVYRLCRWRNERGEDVPIPANVLAKPPSAELRPDQRDDQSLPPYEQLDPILEAYVEGDATAAELIDAGHDPGMVERIVRLVDLAEYKRRQTPPGIRITTKAFGKDRRLPMTNRYRG
ncbi:MAG: Glutamine-dependent NAD(+) synthetase [Acidimicrobiales bacterium]|nr:Glutamine-dependent NAD(+) synthetase [Acidimicrobiales bacterium]